MWNWHCKSYNLILSHKKHDCIKLLHLIILFIFMHNRRWIKPTFITWVPPSLLLLSSWTFSSSCNKKSMFSFCLASKRSFSCCKNIETSVGTTTYLSTQDFGSSTLSSLICKALTSRVFGSLWMEDSMHPSQAI